VIPAPPGITAEYLINENGKTRHLSKAVVAFDDDGEPLVAGTRELVHARNYGSNYELTDWAGDDYTAIIPGGGWRVEWPDGTSEPLIGWAQKPGRRIVALDTDRTGVVEDSDEWTGEYRIYHPDTITPPDPQTPSDLPR
jgi:hypothetical protein